MAYPTYPYPSYQPYYPQTIPDMGRMGQNPWSLQNTQPPPAQPTAPSTSAQNGGINWVNSKQEADNWPIAPGCAVALWDSNNPVIYLRQADSTGKPSTKVYDLVERTENPPQWQQAPQIDLSNYITREQLEEILSERLKRPTKATQKKEDTEND